jgi:DNA ligase 1
MLMPDLADGEVHYVQGSAKEPYELKNVGGVYSCSCPAWRNAGGAIDRRTCKHLKAFRGEEAEIARVGDAAKGGKPASAPKKPKASGDDDGDEAAGDGAPPVLLAHRWENDQDLTGWWMSEKLDGVRAWWDGKQFLSRLGNAFIAPKWFTDGLPNHPLDGELWVARKEFQKCVSIVRRADAGEQWREVKYVVFDAPEVDGGFEARVEYIDKLLGGNKHDFAMPHEHVLCESIAHLKAELDRVEKLGGEGLMMRQPGSKYISGRSTTLLKVKTFHDAEGRVVAHEAGKGKHKGRLGALVVEMPDGTRFNVGTGFSDKERESPPEIGEIITYRYQELTKDGVPRFPSYVGLAIDKAAPTAPTTPKKVVEEAPTKPAIPIVKPKPVSVVDEGAAVRGVVKQLNDGWRHKRWADVEGALHEQCVIIRPDGTRLEGKGPCAASYKELTERTRIIRYSENDHRVDVWGSTAIASCRWEMSWVSGGKPQRSRGTETLALAKMDTVWRVVWRTMTEAPSHLTLGDDEPSDSSEGDPEED